MNNKFLFLLALFALLFLSFCSCDNGGGNNNGNEPPPFGWRSAGLIPNQDSLYKYGTGLLQIVHSKDYLFAIDAKVGAKETAFDRSASRIFMSRQGTEKWEEMEMPENVNPYKIYADDKGLFVGTYGTGSVWRYEPEIKKWTDLKSFEMDENKWYNVYGMARYNGDLVVSLCGYNDIKNDNPSDTAVCHIKLQQSTGGWKNITPTNANFQFLNAVEWRGSLFVTLGTGLKHNGMWQYSGEQWTEVPMPDNPPWVDEGGQEWNAKALAIHKDRLYMAGIAGGIDILNDDFKSWTSIDSIRTTKDNALRSNSPLTPYALASSGKNLFVSGDRSGIPAVYMGDINPNEPKGWRFVDRAEWCSPSRFRCLGLSTYGLDIVNDTLYAAAFEGLYKFPLSDLDSAIANEESYDNDW